MRGKTVQVFLRQVSQWAGVCAGGGSDEKKGREKRRRKREEGSG